MKTTKILTTLFLCAFILACQEEEITQNTDLNPGKTSPALQGSYDKLGNLYTESLVHYTWLLRPRPLPCPGPILAGGQCEPDPSILLVELMEKARLFSVEASIITEEGKVFACAQEECRGSVKQGDQKAYAVLQVVNPELQERPLFLVLNVAYYLDDKLVQEKIYDEFTFDQ